MSKLSTLSLLVFTMLIEPLRALAETAQQSQPNTPLPNYYWPGPWHMWGYDGWHFWGFPLMFLFMALICMIVFLFFARMIMAGGHHWGPARGWDDHGHSALRILNERFAKGEIQKSEYEERKAVILK